MSQGKQNTGGKPVLTRITAKVHDDLYKLILADSIEMECTLGEVLTRVYAASKGQPDLANIEKGRPGRKPGSKLQPVPA